MRLEWVKSAGLGPDHLLEPLRHLRRWRRLEQQARNISEEVGSFAELRAWRLANRLESAGSRRRELVTCFLELVSETLRSGRLRFLRKSSAGQELPFGLGPAGHTEGCDIAAHRFLAARRAEAEGTLHIEVVLAEVDTALPDDDARIRSSVEQAVRSCVLSEIHRRCEDEAIAGAVQTLRGLLERPRLAGTVCGAVVDGKRIYAACLGDDIEKKADFHANDMEGFFRWLEKNDPEVVAVFATAGGKSGSLISFLSNRGIRCQPFSQAGVMRQAKRRKGPIKSQAALIVAERVRDPFTATADLSPDELGLGEYLDQVDEELLEAALEDARFAAGVVRNSKAERLAVPSANPLVKSLDDLRPGLELSGTVANITSFGAFVEVGLGIEGLVHISELSDEFVSHPSEVVRVGQNVRVRVVDFDRARGRLSLSMRSKARKRGPKAGSSEEAKKKLEQLFRK